MYDNILRLYAALFSNILVQNNKRRELQVGHRDIFKIRTYLFATINFIIDITK